MGLFARLGKIVATPEKTKRPEAVAETGSKSHTLSDRSNQSARHKSRGNELLADGKLDEAVTSYLQAIAADPNDADAHLNLGFVLSEQRHYEAAEHALLRALEINPVLADAHYILGTISGARGNPAGAVVSFARALELKPDFEIVYSALSQALVQCGQGERAKQVLLNAVALYPRIADLRYRLGTLCAAERDTQQAIGCYLEALSIQPDHAQAHDRLGHAFQTQGKLEAAIESYRRALSLNPGTAETHNNLGTALQAQGKLEAAIKSYRDALEINPDHASVHNNLGLALHQHGALAEAIDCYQKAFRLDPRSAEIHLNLGNALKDQERLDEAIESYRDALSLKPDYAEAYSNLGLALQGQGKVDAAVESYRRAISLKPDLAEAHSNLGTALQTQGKLEAAIESCRKALSLKPDSAAASINLGNVLLAQDELDGAIEFYERALSLKQDYADAYCNLGAALQKQGKLEAAIRNCQKALSLKPDSAVVHNNLGNALHAQGKPVESIESYRTAISLKPGYAEAHNNLGVALMDLGQLDDAQASYRSALNLDPDSVEAYSNLLFSHNYRADQPASLLLSEARRYGDLVARRARCYTTWNNVPDSARCLRVGLVSGDLRAHPVGYFLEGALAALASVAAGRLELVAYPSYVRDDQVAERIKAHCHGWHSAVGLSDERLAQRIRDDGIDILIDLSGHTKHHRLPLFAWKPAPVQASWLGYFATTGVAAIDYLIADPWTLPESEEIHFTEKIWRLPETRLCFTAPDVRLDVTPLPALSNGYTTFACFNNLTKITDAVVALWARVLAAVPTSRLFLRSPQLAKDSGRRSVVARFAVCGIGAERLILEGAVSRAEYLATYQRVDMALDPFPYTGGTTTAEALWMGVPVLTLAGTTFLSRQGIGLLMNAGLPEWIANDADDYLARAVSHASDLRSLASLREGLRQQVLASPIFDAPRFARHFEIALRAMWQLWCEQEQRHFR